MGWSKGGQDTRLAKLCSKYNFVGKNILDLGCGYGDLLDYLPENINSYLGIDIVPEFISEAKRKYLEKNRNNSNNNSNNDQLKTIDFQLAEFLSLELVDKQFDYVIASGIFNRKLIPNYDNYIYIEAILEKINKLSKDGFAIDFLSTEGIITIIIICCCFCY